MELSYEQRKLLIKGLELLRREATTKLGNETLLNANSPSNSWLRESSAYAEISLIDTTMQALRAQDSQVNWHQAPATPAQAQVCTVCGARLQTGQGFCTVCGSPASPAFAQQPASAPQTPASRLLCPSCGSPVEQGAHFCEICGRQL